MQFYDLLVYDVLAQFVSTAVKVSQHKFSRYILFTMIKIAFYSKMD